MKIMLSGGGTAGHITPLLAVASQLKHLSPDCELYFIGQRGDPNTKLVEDSGLMNQCFYISAGKFRRYHNRGLLAHMLDVRTNLLNFRDVFRVIHGRMQAGKILRTLRPDVVFCKGGFVVVPVGYAAKAHDIPYITHDSDTLPGLANRLIAKNAVYNAVVSSAVTAYPAEKTKVVGVPLTDKYSQIQLKSRSYYKKLLGFAENSILVFVYAGTQGAKVIDDALDATVPELLARHQNVYIAHVFGRLNEHVMDKRYSNVAHEDQSRIHKLSFITNADEYIGAADIIVGRAGATSTAEFATAGRACIIIPAEQLTGGHQLENANVFAATNSIRIVRERDLPKGLAEALASLIDDDSARENLEKAILSYSHKDASLKIAQLIVEAGKSRGPSK